MSFINLYYKRTTATAKACYICFKPTTTVLATINTVDFLYTCPGHLSDSGFATLIPEEPVAPVVSAEEIAKVKTEWEEKQRKLEKAKEEKEKEKAASDSTNKDSSKEKDAKPQPKGKLPPVPGSLSPSPSLPKHERYSLHRDYFAMRQSEHRKRRQKAQAKELAPRLPEAPQGSLVQASHEGT